MYGSAPTRLEQFGAVSCAPPPAPSPGGLPSPRTPQEERRKQRQTAPNGLERCHTCAAVQLALAEEWEG
eukprot:3250735-Alexandrium_andersonii.AAC.1